MKIAGGEAETFFFSTKKIKKIGPCGVKLHACKRQYSKTKFTASYGLLGSNLRYFTLKKTCKHIFQYDGASLDRIVKKNLVTLYL